MLLFSILAGCGDPFLRISGSVEVSPEASLLFDERHRGVLLVTVETARNAPGILELGIICSGSNEVSPFSYDFGDRAGCAEEGIVKAWIEPALPDLDPPGCPRPEQKSQRRVFDSCKALAIGRETLLRGVRSDCEIRNAGAMVRVDPIPPAEKDSSCMYLRHAPAIGRN